jgi:FtsZ-binding cell division protein ZapB
MKTTLTKKIDNYLEKTHGTITLLVAIGVTVGALFALGMSSDYGITTATSFGVVLFLMFFGSVLGALGAYIVAEKIGYANSAEVSRSLHKHYNGELEKVRADERDAVANVRKLSTTVMEQVETIENLQARVAQLEYMNDTNYKQNEKLKAQRDELAVELEEIRYTIHAEQNRLADI